MSFLLLGRVAACDHLTRPVTIQGNKARALLALLLVRANHYVSTDLLEDELWNGAPPRGARSTVHAHISRLRSVIGMAGDAAVLAGRAGGYELIVDPSAIDVNRFEGLATQGSHALAQEPREAADLCARALDEWRGPALRDVRHLPSLQIEAERLDELRLATIETRMAGELHAGSHVMVVGSLQRLVDEHPLREQLRALLMLALFRSGRQAEARRAYQAGYAALVEVGLEPGRELRELEDAIGRADPSLLGSARTGPTSGPVGVHVAFEPDQLRSPSRRLVLIEGPDASTAVEALVASARHAGRAVLRGRDAPTASRPYQSVAEALAPLLEEAVEPELIGALAPIVAPMAPAKGVDPAFQRFQAFEAVLELLDGHAARQPLVLLLDDVDRAGASTLDLLEHLARRGHPRTALALVASRSTTRPNAAFDGWLRRLERDGLVQRMPAGPAEAADLPTVDEQPDARDHAALAADAFAQAAELSARAGDDAPAASRIRRGRRPLSGRTHGSRPDARCPDHPSSRVAHRSRPCLPRRLPPRRRPGELPPSGRPCRSRRRCPSPGASGRRRRDRDRVRHGGRRGRGGAVGRPRRHPRRLTGSRRASRRSRPHPSGAGSEGDRHGTARRRSGPAGRKPSVAGGRTRHRRARRVASRWRRRAGSARSTR